jgi:predicted TIM-barrel fold metal-dependent hydrolase
MGVDSHVHILKVGARLVPDRHSAPSRDTTVPELLALLDSRGLSHAVLTAPSFYGQDNSILLGALAQGGSRLLGSVALGPDATLADLTRLKEAGVRGIRFNLLSAAAAPRAFSRAHHVLFGRAAEAGLHIELLAPAADVPALGRRVLAVGAVLVLDHFGLAASGDQTARAFILDALEAGSTWVKLSAPYRLPSLGEADQWARTLADRRPDRLVWGSDWPWVSHEHHGHSYSATLDWLTRWVPDDAARQEILVGNPARLLGLAVPAPQRRDREVLR